MSTDSSPEVLRGEADRRPSQSLFQVYYLGSSRVDRRCSSSVMPWIVEEHKLKTQEMKLLWLTPGDETVTYVADSGQELFSHPYSSILQCCIAVDGISLAYIARSGQDNLYHCHVFQSLTYEEAKLIMSKFKVHAREEVSIGSTISRDKISDLPMTSSGLIFSSSLKHHPPDNKTQTKTLGDSEYSAQFLGKYEVPPPSSSKDTQVQTIDKLVVKLKENYQLKMSKGKKGFGWRGKLASSSSSSLRSYSADNGDSVTAEGDKHVSVSRSRSNTSDVSQPPPPPVFSITGENGHSIDGHVQTTEHVQTTGHVRNGGVSRQISEQEISDQVDVGTVPEISDQVDVGTVPCEDLRHDSVTSDISMEFDTIPELSSLQDTPVFQSLCGPPPLSSQRVRLVFSGMVVMLVCQETGERVLKKSIRNIACCAQGKKDPECFAFTSTSKEGPDKKYHCHLFLAESKKEVFKILDSFKASFVHALSVGMPAALCDSCPLQQLHTLCKNLEGATTQVAQSIIQECLESLPEADCASIMKQYKHSEHADHEYTQIIVLVNLIRHHFQQRQDSHTHTGTGSITSSHITQDPAPSRLLPALVRAKIALASSFENLKNKQSDRNSKLFRSKMVSHGSHGSQSFPPSSLFSKKTTLDTLLSPIPTSPVAKQQTEEDVRRVRTWSGFIHKSPGSSHSDLQETQGNSPTIDTPVESFSDSKETMASTPKKKTSFQSNENMESIIPSTPVRKIQDTRPRSLRGGKHDRHSIHHPLRRPTLTPPPPDKKYRTHRRATSFAVTSWRQEMFESCTPDRGHNRSTSEILEDFEIIDIDQYQYGPTLRLGRGSSKKLFGGSPQTTARGRWRHVIQQQIILNRMTKLNSLVKKASDDAELRRLKLSYSTPSLETKEAIAQWSSVLSQPDSLSDHDLRTLTLKGIPPSKRSEVWPLLAQCYRARNDPDWSMPPEITGPSGLAELLRGETEFEHNIVVDLARTFPRHPYFERSMEGQMVLRNVLHSYAVADRETGYCQGLSFVTGILLMHSDTEEGSFKLLHQLMNLYGFRDIYFENLVNLQMRLYQLSRLLHDYKPSLYQHLKESDITPFFYAAPWLLTIFASEFPVPFTARVFDMIFLEGTDFILKVVLALLQIHQEAILECEGMETICKNLKTSLPQLAMEQADNIFEIASKFSFGSRLSTFEAEYHMMAELNSSFKSNLIIDDFSSVAEVLKNQNVALIEQLAICHAGNNRLVTMVEALQTQMAAQDQRILELEGRLQSRTSTEDEQSRSSRESLTTDTTTLNCV